MGEDDERVAVCVILLTEAHSHDLEVAGAALADWTLSSVDTVRVANPLTPGWVTGTSLNWRRERESETGERLLWTFTVNREAFFSHDWSVESIREHRRSALVLAQIFLLEIWQEKHSLGRVQSNVRGQLGSCWVQENSLDRG